jgi:hypothetical protein
MMHRLLATVALLLAISSAHASMIWTAVAVDKTQLDALTKSERLLVETLSNAEGEQAVSLDKTWHGIHYLLNGTAWTIYTTAGEAILGGREFGTDLGYGRPRVLSPDQVKSIAKALSTLTAKELSSRYKPQVMEKEGIYPTIWLQEGPQALQELLDQYAMLLRFYQRAAQNKQSIVIAIM